MFALANCTPEYESDETIAVCPADVPLLFAMPLMVHAVAEVQSHTVIEDAALPIVDVADSGSVALTAPAHQLVELAIFTDALTSSPSFTALARDVFSRLTMSSVAPRRRDFSIRSRKLGTASAAKTTATTTVTISSIRVKPFWCLSRIIPQPGLFTRRILAFSSPSLTFPADWRSGMAVIRLDGGRERRLVSVLSGLFSENVVKANRGFTLIELLVVVAIIAILAVIAIPSYLNQTRKSRRNAAEATIGQIAMLEERYRADNPGYLTANTAATWGQLGMADPSGTYYTYTVSAVAALTSGTPSTYSITATAQGTQTRDTAQGTSCTPLTYTLNYDSTNKVINTSSGPAAVCWTK